MVGFIIALIIIGIIAGYLARLLVPGPDPLCSVIGAVVALLVYNNVTRRTRRI
jgi:uncharacterized membrane protein YeaQ/YmgE (transglycosylase-associated protein family)